ncbi:hypothetical protein JQ629_32460 [Bradyrhizobium sp. AUGA SZCCT0222]|uniref:hypothetical protein n=1 Tax=Bradyrhizobium sp. AUGA SZCCT0222 TaxID=2807668 RepID=UPI001BA9D627|nr:hypothetical protein [Bradyrhizobium sp. AUGA SZCCT0222]MBR1272196.1 hypothetical protein [Bradyrhizobium sp. AUGA SZCCT0222]
MLKYNGVSSPAAPAAYVRHVVCFFIRWAALALFTFNRVKVDHSEGSSWNPFSRLPDGSRAISEYAVDVLGVGVMIAALGLAWLIRMLM